MSNVMEGSVIMPKDFSKAEQSDTPKELDKSNLKLRRQNNIKNIAHKKLHGHQSVAIDGNHRIARRLSDQRSSLSKPKTLED